MNTIDKQTSTKNDSNTFKYDKIQTNFETVAKFNLIKNYLYFKEFKFVIISQFFT